MVAGGGNCTISPISATDAIAVASTDSLSYLGAWDTVTFAVNGGQLERNGIGVGSDIVNIQAQYGISVTEDSNIVAQWVDATGATWAAPVLADRNRIKAVRIAVVARNGQPDAGSGNVTSPCSSLTGPAPTGLCSWEGTAASPA